MRKGNSRQTSTLKNCRAFFLPKRLFVFFLEGKRPSSLRQFAKDSLGRPCDPGRTASSTCQTATTRCSTPTRIRLAILKRRFALLSYSSVSMLCLFFCYLYTFFLLCCFFPLVHKCFAVISCFIFASYLGFFPYDFIICCVFHFYKKILQ